MSQVVINIPDLIAKLRADSGLRESLGAERFQALDALQAQYQVHSHWQLEGSRFEDGLSTCTETVRMLLTCVPSCTVHRPRRSIKRFA